MNPTYDVNAIRTQVRPQGCIFSEAEYRVMCNAMADLVSMDTVASLRAAAYILNGLTTGHSEDSFMRLLTEASRIAGEELTAYMQGRMF